MTPHEPDEAFLREVDEGVRRDQVATLWDRYGIAIIAAVVLFLGAVGGWLWWQDSQAKARATAGEDLTQAMSKLEVGDAAAARPVLDRLAKDGPGGYRGLAQMMQAADAAGAGDNAKAMKLLDAVAVDGKLSQPLRDAALIKSVRLGFDTLPPAAVIERLKTLSVPGNAWFGIAGEMTALAHLKAGKPDLAKPLLTAIVRDQSLPTSLRGRAAELALSLGVDAASLKVPGAASSDNTSAQTAPAPAAAPAE
ncbi:tetratricopeptide repeat protein [Sandarakinorhabdus glacialis]|uniref:tetratricopeptide repeat protein n=1 Tax=Sandarakinorhabdus glacialis TaxID=1614636 RepID=UPI001FB0F61D|nr:tetratricopeptide repeat protein [Polymorphobacter glacialis]